MTQLAALSLHLVFVDETGVQRNMTRTHARAPKGERVVESVKHRSANISLVAAVNLDRGLFAAAYHQGSLDQVKFSVWTETVLAPHLRPGDLVIMDNASIHKDPWTKEALEAVGAKLVFQPPYSPDLNPIEKCWSKLKQALRSAKARTLDALKEAIKAALADISLDDIAGFLPSCGYAV